MTNVTPLVYGDFFVEKFGLNSFGPTLNNNILLRWTVCRAHHQNGIFIIINNNEKINITRKYNKIFIAKYM